MFPLKDFRLAIPPTEDGSFGRVRRFDIHTGVDLYTPEGTAVYAIEDGEVVAVDDFTGVEQTGPDIEIAYLYTQVAMIKGGSGVVAYGEIVPFVKTGDRVKEGDIIGRVTSVLPEDYPAGEPGYTPSRSMLHFELYEAGATETVWWHLGEDQPEGLLDPTTLLNDLHRDSQKAHSMKTERDGEHEV